MSPHISAPKGSFKYLRAPFFCFVFLGVQENEAGVWGGAPTKNPRLFRRGHIISGSREGIRAPDRVVTSTPYVSTRLGLSHSHTRLRRTSPPVTGLGIGRLQEIIGWVPHSLVSARFRLLLNPLADFAQDYRIFRFRLP